MNGLKLYRQWDERRLLKWAEAWERKRAQGRDRYVRWAAFVWGGVLINVQVLVEVFMGGGFSFEKFLIQLPLYLGVGWLAGAFEWSSHEKRYKKYLAEGMERRLKQ